MTSRLEITAEEGIRGCWRKYPIVNPFPKYPYFLLKLLLLSHSCNCVKDNLSSLKKFYRHPVSCNLMTSSCAWLWVMMDAGGLMHMRMLSRHLQYPGHHHHHRVIQVSDYDTNDVWSIVTIVTDISLWHWTSAGMRGQDVHVRRILSWVRCRLMADIIHQSWEKMRGLSCNILHIRVDDQIHCVLIDE